MIFYNTMDNHIALVCESHVYQDEWRYSDTISTSVKVYAHVIGRKRSHADGK